MRVILAGSPAARRRLREALESTGITIAGEAASLDEARRLNAQVDAIVVAQEETARRTVALEDDHEPFVESLTARERDVLSLLAEGLSNKGIADRLRISDQTVKFHVASIYGKLGASNRTDAVRIAFRRGLVTL
jgi:DNA-binding NarL/FixJ family response regulator